MSYSSTMHGLEGRRFGRLVALSETRLRGYVAYVCRCDCGAECVAKATDLVSGRKTQCASWDHDMLGRRYGRLVVLGYAGSGGGKVGALMRCRCDCGNETTVPASALKKGNTRSCGCGELESRRRNVAAHDAATHVDGTHVRNLTDRAKVDSESGIRGVVQVRGRWRAEITLRGVKYRLGTYDQIEDAAEARRLAEQALFDPVREAHGLPPIDDEEARARVAEIIDKMDDRDPSPAGATIRDAMDELGVSKQTVYRMIKDGRLVASKSRGGIVIDASSLAAMAKNGQVRRARTTRHAR